MPRLRQVPRSEATAEIVLSSYDYLFGDRDPVAEPGTSTGTPGNWWTVFALVPDVLKHAVLALAIRYLKRKEAPLRVIDTHAGAGRYVLTSPQSAKTSEWQGGIGRLLGPDAKPLPQHVLRHLEPYLAAVRAENCHVTIEPSG